jgi:ADP-ribose pyrophosphatase YjhB (NUDIX family)
MRIFTMRISQSISSSIYGYMKFLHRRLLKPGKTLFLGFIRRISLMEELNPRTMITFRKHGSKFTFRIAGIAIHNERVLCQHSDGLALYWFLPGGRAELGETSEQTLIREMREELDTEIHIERLLYVVENLFRQDGTSHHEIGFYFLITLPESSPLTSQPDHFIWNGDDGPLQWDWLPIAQLPNLPLYPQFLSTALTKNLPDHPLHIVNIPKNQTS